MIHWCISLTIDHESILWTILKRFWKPNFHRPNIELNAKTHWYWWYLHCLGFMWCSFLIQAKRLHNNLTMLDNFILKFQIFRPTSFACQSCVYFFIHEIQVEFKKRRKKRKTQKSKRKTQLSKCKTKQVHVLTFWYNDPCAMTFVYRVKNYFRKCCLKHVLFFF